MAVETTSTLANFVRAHYVLQFLTNLKQQLVFDEFTVKFSVPNAFSPTVNMQRYSVMAGSTATLTEGTVPSEIALTDNQVQSTIAQYGAFVKLSDLIMGTHISGRSAFMDQVVAELSYRAKDSVDLLVRDALAGGTNETYASGQAALSDVVGSTHVALANDIRKIRRSLKNRKVPTFDAQHYIGLIGPSQSYDLQSETATGGWLDANKYTTMENIQKGEIGRLYGVRFFESTNLSTLSQSGTISECYFLGKASVGSLNLKDVTKPSKKLMHINLYIKEPGSAGTSDPLNQLGTVGYKMNYTTKLLEDDRVEVYVAGETP